MIYHKYPQLIESCRKAIEENRCTGCQALEDNSFTGNPDCEAGKIPTANDSINTIKEILGIQEVINL